MSFKEWLFSEGIEKLPRSEYLYGTKHIIGLILAFGLTILFGFLFKNNKKGQDILFTTIAYILLFFEIISRIINFIELDNYTFVEIYDCLMPCHFCSVMVVLMLFAHFLKIEKLYAILSVGGILATSMFLFYPAVGFNTNIIGLSQLYSISSHILGFIYAVLLLVYGRAVLNYKNLKRIIIFFIIIVLYALLLEFVINPGSNYFYFFEDELGLDAPLIYYQLLIVGILVTYVTFMFTIYYLVNKLSKKK